MPYDHLVICATTFLSQRRGHIYIFLWENPRYRDYFVNTANGCHILKFQPVQSIKILYYVTQFRPDMKFNLTLACERASGED